MPGKASPHELGRPNGPEFAGNNSTVNPMRRIVVPGTPPVSNLSAADIRAAVASRHPNVDFDISGSNPIPPMPVEAQGVPPTRRMDLQE